MASCISGSLYNLDLIAFIVGINNFAGNVKLEDLQLPSDNPAGGINFLTVTQLNNPRLVGFDQFGMTANEYTQSIRARSWNSGFRSFLPRRLFGQWFWAQHPPGILYSPGTERVLTSIISRRAIITSHSLAFLFLKPQLLTLLWFLSYSPITSITRVHLFSRLGSLQSNLMELQYLGSVRVSKVLR